MYQVTAAGQEQKITYTEADGQWLIDGMAAHADIRHLGGNRYHIIREGQSALLEVLKADPANKSYTIKVNGKSLSLELKDKTSLLLEQMGLGSKAKAKINDLKAPMPGLIVDVPVQPGQTVQKGEVLLVLEAMKMENAIKAESQVTIDTIKVSKGDKVEKGAILIAFKKEA